MSNLSNQKLIIENLAQQTVAQRALLNHDWHTVCESQNAVVKTIKVAFVAAKAAPIVTAIVRLAFGKPQSRKRRLQTLLARTLRKI